MVKNINYIWYDLSYQINERQPVAPMNKIQKDLHLHAKIVSLDEYGASLSITSNSHMYALCNEERAEYMRRT